MERTVRRSELDRELKRITRAGTERLVSYQVNGDLVTIVTETRTEPDQEIR